MTVDFGAHIYPEAVFPDPIAGSPIDDLIATELRDPDRLRQLYGDGGIDGAVLSQPYYMGAADADATAAANDALLDVVESDEFFYGLAAVPVSAGGDAAAAEFERSLDAGYHGGAVETKTNGVELVDDDLDPVFEVADRTGAPLLVHPKLDESLHPDVFDDTYLLNATFGREAALSESICKVIHQGVLDRYPDLTLVFHHLGGNIASMMGRVHLQLDEGRWPGQGSVKSYEEFKTQLESRMYVDTSGFFGYEAPLRATLEEFPVSNVLFGTDYPFEPRDAAELAACVDAVETVAGDAADRVLAGNAREILVNV
jgi:predicted TIM-barrel fold metal-dependent hydrolase